MMKFRLSNTKAGETSGTLTKPLGVACVAMLACVHLFGQGAVGQGADGRSKFATVGPRGAGSPPTIGERGFDIRSYGAACNRSNDVTSAINATIAAINTAWTDGNGGEMYIPPDCIFDPQAVNWRSLHTKTKVHVAGDVLVTRKWKLDSSKVDLFGDSGFSGVQFQLQAVARLAPYTGFSDDYVLEVSGPSGASVHNIAVYPCGTRGGIQIGGPYGSPGNTALVWLENVSANCADSPPSMAVAALALDQAYWVWIDQGRFMSNKNSRSYSIDITNTAYNPNAQDGLYKFYNIIIAQRGIRLNPNVAVNNYGNMLFHNLLRESGQGPLFDVYLNNDIEDIYLDHPEEADPSNVTCGIQVTNNGRGKLYGLHISDHPLSICGATDKVQVYYDGVADTRFVDLDLTGSGLVDFATRSHRWDLDWTGTDTVSSSRYLPPGMVIANGPQNPANFDLGSWRTATGPYGEVNMAVTITSSAGSRAWNWGVRGRGTTIDLGDWVCGGIKAKGWNKNGSHIATFSLWSGSGSPTIGGDWGGDGLVFSHSKTSPMADQWKDYIGCGKVTALHAGTKYYGINLDLYSDNINPIDIAYPWLAVFPASRFSDGEVLRFKRYGLRTVFYGATLGAHNYRATEKICIGSKCIENSSTNQLGTDAPMTTESIVSEKIAGGKCLHTSPDGRQITETSTDCGVMMQLPSGRKPECNPSHRGWWWYTAATSGAKDKAEVCAKDAEDRWDWRSLY
jgi:hypothetical protein